MAEPSSSYPGGIMKDRRFIDDMAADTEAALRQNEVGVLIDTLVTAGEAWGSSLVSSDELPRLKQLIERLDKALRAQKAGQPVQDHRFFVELDKLFGANKFGIEDTAELSGHARSRLRKFVERGRLRYREQIGNPGESGYRPAGFRCTPPVKWGLILHRMSKH